MEADILIQELCTRPDAYLMPNEFARCQNAQQALSGPPQWVVALENASIETVRDTLLVANTELFNSVRVMGLTGGLIIGAVLAGHRGVTYALERVVAKRLARENAVSDMYTTPDHNVLHFGASRDGDDAHSEASDDEAASAAPTFATAQWADADEPPGEGAWMDADDYNRQAASGLGGRHANTGSSTGFAWMMAWAHAARAVVAPQGPGGREKAD